MRKWNVQNKLKTQSAKIKAITQSSKLNIEEVIAVLLENRGIKTKKETETFLYPKLKEVTIKSVGIDKIQLKKALKRIQGAIEKKEHIVVFGDYDVDGICGSAILWETLNSLGANILPYIPHRIDEGYGLSIKGIENILSTKRYTLDAIPSLIITVDNGIVANEAVEFGNKQNIDVIITDHHVPGKKLPKAHAIVHTTKLCGTGVAYLLAKEFSIFNFQFSNKSQILNKSKIRNTKYEIPDTHLELVALATVADLVPLTFANRTLLKFGLENLQKTKRPGVVAMCLEAGIDQKVIGTYEIGHVIAPRLNAMGRLEYAMESLRLLCTKDRNRARLLADKLGSTNRERQTLTIETVQHAISGIKNNELRIMNEGRRKKLLFIVHESYQQGVIGLVAGRLVEEFYRPSIVVAKGEKYSKASARSVSGFNIIEFIRSASDLLVDAGGHPMAAGFTVETAKLVLLQETLEKKAEELLSDDILTRSLRVDCELSLSVVEEKLYGAIQKLAPFGMGNPEPTFLSKNVVIGDMRLVGKEGKHVKFKFSIFNFQFSIGGIGFGLGERTSEFHPGGKVDIVYTIDENIWNGNKNLQLKVKDIQKTKTARIS